MRHWHSDVGLASQCGLLYNSADGRFHIELTVSMGCLCARRWSRPVGRKVAVKFVL